MRSSRTIDVLLIILLVGLVLSLSTGAAYGVSRYYQPLPEGEYDGSDGGESSAGGAGGQVLESGATSRAGGWLNSFWVLVIFILVYALLLLLSWLLLRPKRPEVEKGFPFERTWEGDVPGPPPGPPPHAVQTSVPTTTIATTPDGTPIAATPRQPARADMSPSARTDLPPPPVRRGRRRRRTR